MPLSGQSVVEQNRVSVPPIIKLNGTLPSPNGTISLGPHNVTSALYEDQYGGIPLWTETQIVFPDNQGHFSVLLGASTFNGIPPNVFLSGEPRWVGFTEEGAELPRIELFSVPYAFKASDADTLGGRPVDYFASQQQLDSLLSMLKPPTSSVTTASIGPVDPPTYIATSPIDPSVVSMATAGPPFQVNAEAPVSHLNTDSLRGLSDSAFALLSKSNDFPNVQMFSGGVDLPASNLEPNAASIVDSAPLSFLSSSPSSRVGSVVTQQFLWSSQPVVPPSNGINAKLSLFYGANGATPVPTGLFINSDGTINFATGQTLPATAVTTAISAANNNGGGPLSPNSPIVNTSYYPWVQTSPSTQAIVVGQNIVTLKPCPRGVNGTDAWHYLYLSGTGSPEVVLITGGSCISRAATGTIEFSASYPHLPGFSLGTATDGIQEALIDADVIRTAGAISRQVMVDPGSHFLRARVSVRSSSMTITSSGATLTCAMADTCLMLGDPSNSNEFQSIVVQGLRMAPGAPLGTFPAVEDNAQGSQISDFGPAISAVQGASFGSLVQIDNDQAAVINGLSTTFNYAWGRCDATFCSAAIVGPGPFSKNAGVLWVENSNLSLQCGGNGIDNQDGNTLKVSNSIVQGYAQFGIRAATVYQLNTVNLSSVYEEEDGYCNPLGTGSAGLIVEGGQAITSASPSAGLLPMYANTGLIQFYYYVVVHSSKLGTSPAYLAGSAATNGSGQIKVLWNQVGNSGVITYDLLRIAGDGGADMAAPNGTGPFAVAVNLLASSCSNQVCTAIDNAGTTPSFYTVAENTPYWPSLRLWPGSVILTSASDTVNSGGGNPTAYYTDQLQRGIYINSAGNSYPSVFAQECNPQGSWSSIWMQCVGGNSVGNDWPAVTATLLQESSSGGAPGGLKGRLIFELPPGAEVGPTEVITLSDANPDKTLATPGNRPSWDPNDSFIGYDGGYFPGQMQISFGSPVSISRYIGNPGDGINYLERLTATLERYRVPIQLDTVLFSSLPILPDGTVIYCADCQNAADDGALFDSNAMPQGHGTKLLHENGSWRVH